MTELYKKHRPTEFADVYGQKEAVTMLSKMVERRDVPHTLLFCGPSGTGKTTLARILRTKIGCSDGDFREMNGSSSRGIDDIRDIQSKLNLLPVKGRCRVILVDECFEGSTPISTPNGCVSISDIHPGDVVRNITGDAVVERVFKNKVALDRVVLVHLSDGTKIATTKQHKFLTQDGWQEAQYLAGVCVLREFGYSVAKEISHASMSMVQAGIHNQTEQTPALLFQELRGEAATISTREWENRKQKMPRVRDSVYGQNIKHQAVLRPILCSQIQEQTTRISTKSLHGRNKKEDIRKQQKLLKQRAGASAIGQIVGKDDRKKPHVNGWCSREDAYYKGKQRHATPMACGTGRQRANNPRATGLMGCTRQNAVATGMRNPYRLEIPVPPCLQSRPRQESHQNSHRNRWEEPQVEKEYANRSEKDGGPVRVRVVCVEVYQRGCNDESFLGVVGDQEKRNGFVEFYDLQIKGHPSYFANGAAVHNCHALTKDAQNAFLKMLEDTPKHVYFMLCTTEPSKLLKTIVTRCTEVKCKELGQTALADVVQSVCKAADISISAEVLERITDVAAGSARKAVVLLNQIVDVTDEEEQLRMVSAGDFKAQGIEIARALFNKSTSWQQMAKILKGVDEEPEGLRHMVMSYCSAILLNGKDDPRAFLILDVFLKPFYENKKNGLVAACYEVISSKK